MLLGLTGSWSRSTNPSFSYCWTQHTVLERLTAGIESVKIGHLSLITHRRSGPDG